MKKHRNTILMLLFFFMGLIVLLYPSLSNFYNQKVQSIAVANYEALLKEYDDEDYTKVFSEASDYNKRLSKLEKPLLTYNTLKDYKDILDINGNGMMGYLEISKINVELPIYHGTGSDVLSKAVGHIEGTSLPIGGLGTHSVLSAHRGLPSSRLFTDLDKLEVGDTFTITILNQLLTYEVDQILIVEPDDVEELAIDPEEDYVTLVTCTPYGINTHRMLVRGKRIENAKKKTYITTEAYKISNLIVAPMVAIPIIFVLLLIIIFKPTINERKRLEEYINFAKSKNRGESLEVENNDNEES